MGQNQSGRRWRHKLFTLVVVVMLVFLPAGYIYLAQQDYTVAAVSQTLALPTAEPVNLPWPEQGTAAIGAVGYGLLAYSGNPDQAMPIASITKLFTALAVLEKKPITAVDQGELITFTAADAALVNHYFSQGGSVVPISAGQQLTEYQALEAMLVPSANNMADTLAIWAFGSMEAYLEYANSMVQRKGFTATTLAGASGFSPGTVSSPRDLIKLGDTVANHPLLSEIIKQSVVTLPGIGPIYSTNKLLGQGGIIGAKTGNTDEARDCFLGLATHTLPTGEELTLISLVLGQPDRPTTFAHTQSLLAAAQNGFTTTEVVKAGTVIGEYRTPWNTKTPVQADEDITVVRWKASELQATTHLEEIEAGQPAGHEVGTITIQSGDTSHESGTSLKSPLTEPSLWWRLMHIL